MKVSYRDLLWVIGKYKKTSGLSLEPPFPILSDLLGYPTDHVAIKPHYGTFQKSNLYR